MSTMKVNTVVDSPGTGAPDFPNGVKFGSSTLAGVATQAEAQAGTDNTKVMTPLRAAEAIASLVSVVGVGQTWVNVTGSRSGNTSYQNTTGRAIMVTSYNQGSFQVSVNNSTWVTVTQSATINSGPRNFTAAIVPGNHYYRITSTSIEYWAELR
jgi:hypothetical protein